MLLVIDASVAAKWFVQEPDSAEAAALLDDPGNEFIALDLIRAELLNVLWRKWLARAVESTVAHEIAAQLDRYFAEIVPSDGLATWALSIALELRHPVYDCFYLALAEQRSATLVTADKRFYDAVQGTSWGKRIQLLS
jgi:predicted nucleic acid-binding protein